MSEHMNRTQADLAAADEAAKDNFGIDTDPQHRNAPMSAPEDRERQPATQPANREPAVKDHEPLGGLEPDYADSGSTKETAVNYQGPATEPGDDTGVSGGTAAEHNVQGKNRKR
jgi:hypothetical protein